MSLFQHRPQCRRELTPVLFLIRVDFEEEVNTWDQRITWPTATTRGRPVLHRLQQGVLHCPRIPEIAALVGSDECALLGVE